MYTITKEQREIIHKALITACDNGTFDEFTKGELKLIENAERLVKNLTIPCVTVPLPTNKQIESRIKRHLKVVGHVDGMYHIAHDFRQGALYVTRFAKRKKGNVR